jgi:3-oxoacyl-[acyl-carrier protein] reductase
LAIGATCRSSSKARVNKAAIFPRTAFPEMTWDEWKRVIAVNLHGPFLCVRALVPQMIGRRFGRIVNVASGLGVTGGVNAAHYATSKGGLIAFTKCFARELAPFGVTANVIVPGLSDTRMPRRGQSDKEIRALVDQIPMKRLAQPREAPSTWRSS